MTSNAYKDLGVPNFSQISLVRKQFLKLAKVYHPDNARTGNHNRFQGILNAYETLLDPVLKSRLDNNLKNKKVKDRKSKMVLSQDRVIIPSTIGTLAKFGLMKKGLKQRHREKYLGQLVDYIFRVYAPELKKNLFARVNLTTRELCPSCFGSDIHCAECDGKGSYKSSYYITFSLWDALRSPNKVHELDLLPYKPGPFIHFKKKLIHYKVVLVKPITG